MSFKLSDFIAAPSQELLDKAKKSDLLDIADHYGLSNIKTSISQGARNLKIRFAQLTCQKRFDCIDDKNYPSTTFLGTSYGQIVVAIFQEQAFCTTTPFCNCLRKSAT